MQGGIAAITLNVEGTINLKKVNRDLYKGLIDLTVLTICEDKTWEGLLKAARKVQYSVCHSQALKGAWEYARALTKESKDFRALYKAMKHSVEESQEDFLRDLEETWAIIAQVRKETAAIEGFKAFMAEMFPHSSFLTHRVK